jgi:hypothetical protein
MKKPLLIICLCGLVISAMYSCKKDSKAPTPALNIAGTYRISAIETGNPDSNITNEQLSSCGMHNNQVFTASGGVFGSSSCSADTTKGTWNISGNILTIRDVDGIIGDEGIVKNLTSGGFVLDEHAAGWGADIVTFVKE